MSTPRKTCLITGCSIGGIGASLASTFASSNYDVFATARNTFQIPHFLHENPNITVLTLDVTSSASITAAVASVQEATGSKLDVLINNAGIGLELPVLDTPLSAARQLFDVNFFGTLGMIQAFAPMLINARGCIVNNSSVGGFLSIPFISIYQASKAALTRFSEVLRLELAPLGVRVITLVTGGVATKFVANLQASELPQGSYYMPVKDVIAEKSKEIPYAMAPEVYAEEVLRNVERGATGMVWVGGAAGWVRLAFWFAPQWLLVRFSYPYWSWWMKCANPYSLGSHVVEL